MALGHSPSIVRNGLVFYYDMNNRQKSWKGKPTTNLYTNGHFAGGNHVTQAQNGSLSNPVNEVIAMKNPGSSDYCLRTTSVGGSPYTEYEIYLSGILTANTTYCLSCWYALSPDWNGNDTVFHSRWWNADGSEQGALGGGGWTVAETKVVGSLTWKRVYITFSTGATTNGNHSWYAGYPAQNTAGYRYFTDFQIEAGSTPTPFSNGARSNTQAILDITNNNVITTDSLTYNANGTFSFNGTSNVISAGSSSSLSFTNAPFTLESIFNITAYQSGTYYGLTNMLIERGPASTYNYALQVGNSTTIDFIKRTGSESLNYYGFSVPSLTNNNTFVTLTYNGSSSASLYRNGELVGTVSVSNVGAGGSDVLYIGGNVEQRAKFTGTIYSTRIYNRALTASEVLQNFNAQRGIYGV